MNIGLYFGSFNPIHVGHLIIANHVLNETALEKVWFVVSPQNPFKENHTLLNEYDRLHLVKLATEDDPRIRVSDLEFHLPKPSYSSNTLAYLREKYPSDQFSIIMGSDSFQNLHRWNNAEYIIANYPVIVYERPGFDIQNPIKANLTVLQAPLLQISATEIRQLIKQKKSIRYLVPHNVREEIEAAGYYKK